MQRWPLNNGLLFIDLEGDAKFRNVVTFDYLIIVIVTS